MVLRVALGRLGVAARKRVMAARELKARVIFWRVKLLMYAAFLKISPMDPPAPAG